MAHDVECDLDLVGESAPELDGAVRIKGGQAGQRVIFDCFDGRFRCVHSVVVGLNKLNSSLL